MSILTESNSRRRISTTTRIPLAPLNSNNSHTSSPQTPIHPSPTNSKFRRLQNVIKSCRTWKFDKENSSNHPLYIYLKQNRSKDKGSIRNEIPKEISKKKEKTKQYKDKKIEILLCISNLLIGFDGNGEPLKGWQSLFLNAWRMTRPTFNLIFNHCIDRSSDCGRKERI